MSVGVQRFNPLELTENTFWGQITWILELENSWKILGKFLQWKKCSVLVPHLV